MIKLFFCQNFEDILCIPCLPCGDGRLLVNMNGCLLYSLFLADFCFHAAVGLWVLRLTILALSSLPTEANLSLTLNS